MNFVRYQSNEIGRVVCEFLLLCKKNMHFYCPTFNYPLVIFALLSIVFLTIAYFFFYFNNFIASFSIAIAKFMRWKLVIQEKSRIIHMHTAHCTLCTVSSEIYGDQALEMLIDELAVEILCAKIDGKPHWVAQTKCW